MKGSSWGFRDHVDPQQQSSAKKKKKCRRCRNQECVPEVDAHGAEGKIWRGCGSGGWELFIKEEGAELKYGERVSAEANVHLEAAGGSAELCALCFNCT